MTCRDFIEFLMDYESNTLSEDERAIFDSHLAECPACVAYLQTYRDTIHLERAAFDEEGAPPPGDIPDQLVQAILATRKK